MANNAMAQPSIQNALIAKMLSEGTSSAPVGHWTQGLNRVAQALLGGLEMRDQDRQEREAGPALLEIARRQQGMPPGGPQMPAGGSLPPAVSSPGFAPPAPPAVGTVPPRPADDAIGTTPQDRINLAFGATPQDREIATRTVLGEAGNQGRQGMDPVADVIRNRALAGGYGGTTMGQVSQARNQFEPWNTPQGRARMASFSPNSQAYGNAQAAVDSAGVGTRPDASGGAHYFYSPAAQAQLAPIDGRPVVPPFAAGRTPTAQAGGHNFYAPPTRVAQAGGVPPASGALAAPPPVQPGPQAGPDRFAMAEAMIRSDNRLVRAQGQALLQQLATQQPKVQTVGDNLVEIAPNGQVRVLHDATKKTDDERNLDSENRARAARNLPPLSITDFKAANAAATAQGTQQGETTAMLPAAESRVNRALQGIDEIRNHPGRLHGVASNAAVLLQGTPQYDFKRRVDQLKGGAFLEAFQMLKGGGAVTEAEGNKASIAMERMDRALSKKDFDAALDDYQAAVRDGFAKLKLKARGESSLIGQATPGGAPQEARTIGTKNYVKINGQWFEQ